MDPRFCEYEVKKLRSPACGKQENEIFFLLIFTEPRVHLLGYSCTEMRAIIHAQQMRCCYAHSYSARGKIFFSLRRRKVHAAHADGQAIMAAPPVNV